MAKKSLQVQEDVSPNLIPMIDIMFLLLLFFMLGADMGQRELEEVFLPKALAVKEEKNEKSADADDRIVVNVFHRYKEKDVFECPIYDRSGETHEVCREKAHWRIGIKGVHFNPSNPADLQRLEARLLVEGNKGRTKPEGKLSAGQVLSSTERPVMVRADQAAPYGFVQEVINSCAKVGIYKIECGAARPPDAEFQDTTRAGTGKAAK